MSSMALKGKDFIRFVSSALFHPDLFHPMCFIPTCFSQLVSSGLVSSVLGFGLVSSGHVLAVFGLSLLSCVVFVRLRVVLSCRSCLGRPPP